MYCMKTLLLTCFIQWNHLRLIQSFEEKFNCRLHTLFVKHLIFPKANTNTEQFIVMSGIHFENSCCDVNNVVEFSSH